MVTSEMVNYFTIYIFRFINIDVIKFEYKIHENSYYNLYSKNK